MMKKNKQLVSFSVLCLVLIGGGIIFGIPVIGQEIPPEEQQTLIYDVLEWKDGSWESTEWTVWEAVEPYGSFYRGNFSSNDGGKIEITITGHHTKNMTTETFEELNYVPYANIYFFDKIDTGYGLNFSLSNISMNEIAMILAYGFIGWNPGFKISTNWEINAQYALSKQNLGYTEVDVEIINETDTVTYKFQQLDGLGQSTVLTYNKTDGILLEAVSEIGFYKSHIRLQGYSPSSIPGYEFSFIILASIIGVSVILRKRRKFLG